MLEKPRQFIREVISEGKQVAWPTKQVTMASTIVVIILVLIISFYIGIVDFILSRVVGVLL